MNKVQCSVMADFRNQSHSDKSMSDAGNVWATEYARYYRNLNSEFDSFTKSKTEQLMPIEVIEDKRPLFSLLWLEGRSLMKDGCKLRGFRSYDQAIKALQVARGKANFIVVG